MTKWKVVMFVKCGGCNYKDTKTHENCGQGFVLGEHLRNVCSIVVALKHGGGERIWQEKEE